MDYYKFTKKDFEKWNERRVRDSKVKMSVSKKDTFYYSVNTLGVTPLQWQMKFWDLLDAGHKRIAICTPRQVGKSLAIAVYALKAVTLNIAPAGVDKKTRVGIISATEEQSKKLMSNIRDLIIMGDKHVELMTGGKTKKHFTNQIDNSKSAANNKTTITFMNGNQIVCLPPTNRVRGYTFSYVFVDEAAFLEDPDIFFDSIEPTVSQTNGVICLTSTPNGQQGFFYDIFDPEEKYDKHEYKRFWLHYKDLDQPDMIERIEEKKDIMSKSGKEKHFQQEYEAQFNVQVSAFFDSEDVDKMFTKELRKYDSFDKPCDLGVDFGMVNSHTVLTVAHLADNGTIERIYSYQYPFGTDDNLIEDIAELRKRFNIKRIIPDDCLDWETEIIVFEDGCYKPKKMKDIISGDLVLSYNFNKQEFENKKVIDSLDKGIKETKEIKIRNGTKIYATPNHKFYYRHNIYKNREGYKPYSELNNHYDRLTIVRDLMDCEDFDINDNLIYLYGVYMAEGSHHEGEGRCFLAQSEEKNREKYYKIKEKLDMLGIIYSETKRRNGFTLFSENPINKKLQSFGTYHYNKKFPDEIFKYSKRQLEILLEGLLDGDGWRTKPKINKDGKKSNIEFGYTSTSYELIKQISWILRRLGKPANMWSRLPSNRKYRQYNLSYNSNSWFNKEYKKGISLVGFEEIRPCETHVWDINVEDNNNFVLYESGLVVHNCAEGHFKIQEMEKKGWRTTPMSFKKDKVEKYTTFRSKLRQGKIKSYRDGALGVEMKALQEEEGIRSTKIHKPLGGTDDLIDCFVMACYHYLDNGGTELRVYDW